MQNFKPLKAWSLYKFPLIAGTFAAYGLFLRYQCLSARSFWVDEVCQLQHTLGKFLPIWQRLSNGELTCFPGDYLITYPFVNMFSGNKWGMAIPHILATLLGYYFLYLICRRYLKNVFAFTIPFFLMTFNQWLIYHSFELRPYAVLPTLALGCFYFSGRITQDYAQLELRKKIGIGLFFTFTVFYHAYGLLIAGSSLGFFVFARFNGKPVMETLKKLRYFLFLLAVIVVPIFLWYASGNPDFTRQANISRGINTFDYIPNPINHLDQFYRTVMNALLGSKQWGAKFLLFGLALSLLIPHENRIRQVGFLLILIILPIELILWADADRGYWFLQRQFVWAMPLFAFLIGWVWDSVILKLKSLTPVGFWL